MEATTDTKLTQFAQEISNNLTTITPQETGKYDDTRVVWKDEASESLREWWSEANRKVCDDDFNSLDEVYRVLYQVVSTILEEPCTIEELREAIENRDMCDDGNGDLLMWLHENLSRGDAVDEVLAEMETPEMYRAIQIAQARSRETFALQILDLMLEKVQQ